MCRIGNLINSNNNINMLVGREKLSKKCITVEN